MITQAIVTLLFVILGIAIVGWIGFILPEFRIFIQKHASLAKVVQAVFNAAPVQQDASNAGEPVKIVVKGILPLLFWLLILLPMFVFPIVLIIFPLMHIPWSYLLPPSG